ncbi:uncharacterized protein YybS (DUF2232 family) [Alkalibacillus flavidus]|uniref:Uncharacterized protein YybS (DUF2232 family) n=1 Tax=Alkalibacillus flavidus TaxID=546021 RepID=A0ABV2KW72_9BACI
MTDRSIVQQGALFALAFIALLLMTFFIPFISIITIFLLPIPFILLTYRYGWKVGGVVWIITTLVSIPLLTLYSLPLSIVMGLSGVIIGAAMHGQRHPYEVLARGTIGFAVTIALLYASTQLIFDVNWTQQAETLMEESLTSTTTMLEETGVDVAPEDLEIVRNSFYDLVYLIPTSIVLLGLGLAFIAQWLSYKWLNRSEQRKHRFPPFRYFTFPNSLIWIFLLGIIMSWIYTEPTDTMYLAATNLYALPGLLLVLQGMAFVFYYAHYKNWSNTLPVLVVVAFVLFPFIITFPLRILGIFDLGFRLRQRLTGNK